MKPLKNLVVSVNARLGQAVNQLENHEAVAESIITEVERTAARAKVQLGRIRSETSRLDEEMDRLRDEEERWIDRARKVYGVDEERSLECVRRLKRVRGEIRDQAVQIRDSSALERQLTTDLKMIEEKLSLLRRRKKSLSGRQNCASALKTVQDGNLGLSDEINDLFTRWEMKVTEWEIRADSVPEERDDFEDSFTKEEEEIELKKCLQELVAGEDFTESPEKSEEGTV